MDKSEALLFQHISIVINLLNCFTHKHNITSSDVLHRLDYLYERLSDFLGRELNEWWLNSNQEEFQFSQHFTPQIPNLLKPGTSNLQLSEYFETTKPSISLIFNSETSQNDGTKNTIAKVTHSSASSSKEGGTANPEVQETHVSDIDYGDGKFPNCVEPTQDVTESEQLMSSKATEVLSPVVQEHCSDDKPNIFKFKCEDCNEEIISFNADKKMLMSLHIQSAGHQKTLKQEIKTSSVSIEAKRNVTGKKRNDLGKFVIEKVTTTYYCNVCNENIFNTVRDHVFNIKHQANMREKKGIEIAGTDNTEYICKKSVTNFHCTLCSMDMSSIKDAKDHKYGQRHVNKLLEEVSDPNIKVTKKELYTCTICSVKLSSLSVINGHLKGKLHQKKLEEHLC